jgi:hypothetical protein
VSAGWRPSAGLWCYGRPVRAQGLHERMPSMVSGIARLLLQPFQKPRPASLRASASALPSCVLDDSIQRLPCNPRLHCVRSLVAPAEHPRVTDSPSPARRPHHPRADLAASPRPPGEASLSVTRQPSLHPHVLPPASAPAPSHPPAPGTVLTRCILCNKQVSAFPIPQSRLPRG